MKELNVLVDRIGKDINEVRRQVALFEKGVEKTQLEKPAVLGDGLVSLELEYFLAKYELLGKEKFKLAFVPASGAATRMFKELFLFLETEKASDFVVDFFENLYNFSFSKNIPDYLNSSRKELLEYLLKEEGLGYGNLPKGLIPFHSENGKLKTAFQAQLDSLEDLVNECHFTISEAHKSKFESELKKINFNKKVDFSFQKSSTDTIAVDLNNKPFLEDGSLLFRPGGHGALIENLNDIEADIIFIKNIDNVAIDKIEAKNIMYKKALAGMLLELQVEIFENLHALTESTISDVELEKIKEFAISKLNISIPTTVNNLQKLLLEKLNRPIRVCGMIKNEGQPGGGPFWVKDENEEISLQIVEGAQMDKNNPEQLRIMNQATHFNPVELVCGVKDYQGNKFNLLDFVDEEAVFITEKSRNGKIIKALERPGLWNGAMANWITIFVEVPSHIFNPVKTVNDLLKPNHQNG